MTTATIVLEVFPADVEGPDGVHFRQARVVSDGGYVWVFTADGHQPRLAHAFTTDAEFDYEPISRLRPRRWSVTSNVGEEWTVTVGTGCGCGNPLKHVGGQALLNTLP